MLQNVYKRRGSNYCDCLAALAGDLGARWIASLLPSQQPIALVGRPHPTERPHFLLSVLELGRGVALGKRGFGRPPAQACGWAFGRHRSRSLAPQGRSYGWHPGGGRSGFDLAT